MKKILWSFLLLAACLSSTGCYEEQLKKLDELEDRADALTVLVRQLNENMKTLRDLMRVIDRQDMITGITEIRSEGVLVSYRINFVDHDPITISNGADGKKPLISSRQNPDDKNYYWAVQYGDEGWEWLLSPDGQKMLSIGDLPYITIRNGRFMYTLDGKTWVDLGPANGQNGDQMFASINTYNTDYVLITLTTGEVLKIPTYSAFLALKSELDKTNENVDAQVKLIRAAQEKITWITSIQPILNGKDTAGLTVSLSNGQQFSIHDWTSSMSPAIFVKRDTDGHLYWAYTIGTNPEQWVLSPEGNKIPAESTPVDIPLISIERDTDGEYYWVVTTGDSTAFLRTRVSGQWQPQAVDTVKSIFSQVSNYTDSLVVVLKDGTRFNLPKQYTVTLTDTAGNPIGDQITMADGGTATLCYKANGNNVSVSLLTQGGFTATEGALESGAPCILVKAPNTFTSGSGKVVIVFTFPSEVSPITVVKSITIKK